MDTINDGDVLRRADKVAFAGTALDATKYLRMHGFTDLGNSKNAKTYNRQYVDEQGEREDVTGYAPEKSYAFDDTKGDKVQEKFKSVADDELTGTAAQIPIVTVDFSQPKNSGYVARKRVYSIIPDSDGDSTDAYTYSGSLKSVPQFEKGIATSDDNWESCSFAVDTKTDTQQNQEQKN